MPLYALETNSSLPIYHHMHYGPLLYLHSLSTILLSAMCRGFNYLFILFFEQGF